MGGDEMAAGKARKLLAVAPTAATDTAPLKRRSVRLGAATLALSLAALLSAALLRARGGWREATAPCPSHQRPPALPFPPPPTARNEWQVSGKVGGRVTVTSEDFRMLGVNLDFWPSTEPKWGACEALTSNLADPLLLALTSRLNGSLLRIGGSPADFMLYDVFDGACSAGNLNKTRHSNRSYFCPIWDQVVGQCLTMDRWQDINSFALTSGFKIMFDLNACWGRSGPDSEMDFTMIAGLFNRTAEMAAHGTSAVWAFQFGNEVYTQISPTRYAKDMLAMKAMLRESWARLAPGHVVPKLAGPDNGWDGMSASYLDGMLSAGGADAMIAATYHDYPGSNRACSDFSIPAGLALNVSCLEDDMQQAIARFSSITTKHGVYLWVTEAALSGNSGTDGRTNAFVSSLWYAHMFGQLARSGVGLLCRQTLMGGDYELIDRRTGAPNPDYYVALLWHDLVGSEVLDVRMEDSCQRPHSNNGCAGALRVYAHTGVRSRKDLGGTGGGMTIVLIIINFSTDSTFSLSLQGPNKFQGGLMWQLRGQPHSSRIFLNEQPLEYNYSGAGEPPQLLPTHVGSIQLLPISVTFVEY